MAYHYIISDSSERAAGLSAAAGAIGRAELVVFPTDTVYGLAADAFDPAAVASLLAAKGRGREMPPPVMVSGLEMFTGIAEAVAPAAMALADAFWPGALTIIVRQVPSLQWDIGETRGTVAVRMPMHRLVLDLIERTGPLAVSSANLTGRPAATSAVEAAVGLGEKVAVYLDGGRTPAAVPSTIVDATGSQLRVVRAGVIEADELRAVTPDGWGE